MGSAAEGVGPGGRPPVRQPSKATTYAVSRRGGDAGRPRAVSAFDQDTERSRCGTSRRGRAVRTLEGHSIGARRGGDAGRPLRRLRLGRDKTLKVWDLAGGRVVRAGSRASTRCHGRGGDAGRRVAVSASWDATLKVWDLADRREVVRTLAGHGGRIRDVGGYTGVRDRVKRPPVVVA